MAELMEDQGRILATEVSEERCGSIRENVARLGLTSVEVRHIERATDVEEDFDAVLIDVPWLGVDAWSFVAPKATTGGVLVTCSCSYNISEAAFAQIIYEAAIDAASDSTAYPPSASNSASARA